MLLEHPDVAECGRDRPARSEMGRGAGRLCRAARRLRACDAEALEGACADAARPLQGAARISCSSTTCRATRWARCSISCCDELRRASFTRRLHFEDRGARRRQRLLRGRGRFRACRAMTSGCGGATQRPWWRSIAPAGSRIIVKDLRGRHEAQLALVTTDIAAAVRRRRADPVPCPGLRAARYRPRCSRRIWPTARSCSCRPATFGSMIFAKATHDAGNRARRRFRRDRHAALADPQARPVRGRHHHPRQAAADRRVSARDCRLMRST